jgi:hypothetical protein
MGHWGITVWLGRSLPRLLTPRDGQIAKSLGKQAGN